MAGETFVAQNNGFGGVLSDVTNLIGEKHLRERSLALAASRHSRSWTPSFECRVRMLLTEHDAVMKKWCPMIRLRWEARPFAFNRSNPGRSARFRNMLYRMFFPRLHHEMRGNFFRCQGSGCMVWRWETRDPPPLEKGSPHPSRARDIVAWQARPSRSLRSDAPRVA